MNTAVAIVDDDARLRCSVAHAVLSARDLRFVGAADDLDSGRRLVERERPDVLLVNLHLHDDGGLEMIRFAVHHGEGCDVMVLSTFDDEVHVLASVEAGATGYLLNGWCDVKLAEHIRTLRSGGSPVSPVIVRRLLSWLEPVLARGHEPASFACAATSALSAKEHSVLRHGAKGLTHAEIAHLMGVSSHTVLTHVKRAYRKLQAHSRTEALNEARSKGWLQE